MTKESYSFLNATILSLQSAIICFDFNSASPTIDFACLFAAAQVSSAAAWAVIKVSFNVSSILLYLLTCSWYNFNFSFKSKFSLYKFSKSSLTKSKNSSTSS